jgi:hypothetical protein
VEILAPLLPLPKGKETAYIKNCMQKREEEGLDWNGKRGGNVEMKWDVARPNFNSFSGLLVYLFISICVPRLLN